MDMTNYAGSESKYLKAADLNGKKTVAKISGVELVQFENDGVSSSKPAISFEGKSKAMVLNATNTAALIHAFGAQSEDWLGGEVELSSKHYPAFGKDGLVLDPVGGAEPEFDDDIPF
jgi:hypothetical protein